MARYNYWNDLRSDIRKPVSRLDMINMILRRFGLILVWHYVKDDYERGVYRFHWWPKFIREKVEPLDEQ